MLALLAIVLAGGFLVALTETDHSESSFAKSREAELAVADAIEAGNATGVEAAWTHLPFNRQREVAAYFLYRAARVQDSSVLRTLLKLGVHIDSLSPQGNTALSNAASLSESRAVEMLIRHGANVNALNTSGETPLMSAAEAGDLQSVCLLLDSGADPLCGDSQGHRALEHATAGQHGDVVAYLALQQLLQDLR